MDAPSVFPNGFHPCDVTKDRGGSRPIITIPRYKAKGPINYYFIDFGISCLFQDDMEHLTVGNDGADRDVPEMSPVKPYNPFPADVFILGNILKKEFLPVRSSPIINRTHILTFCLLPFRCTKTSLFSLLSSTR